MKPIEYRVQLVKTKNGTWSVSIPEQLLDWDERIREPWEEFCDEIDDLFNRSHLTVDEKKEAERMIIDNQNVASGDASYYKSEINMGNDDQCRREMKEEAERKTKIWSAILDLIQEEWHEDLIDDTDT